jgi:hypothetical protein
MVEKYKLNLAVVFTIILITSWLVWARRVWDWVRLLLLAGAIVLIIWTLLLRGKKPAKREFFLKSLAVSYIATSIIWFTWLFLTSPPPVDIFSNLMKTLLVAPPLSFFPVSISIIIYGIFRKKLNALEIFLSSWYASIFAGLIYDGVWYYLNINPYQPPETVGVAFTFAFLSLPIACILTIVYLILKK